MADPFAERPIPWWKRRRSKSTKYTPPRQAAISGGLGGLLTFAISGHSPAKTVLVAAATALPPALLETWHKRRHRRREERLFELPEDGRSCGTPSTSTSSFSS